MGRLVLALQVLATCLIERPRGCLCRCRQDASEGRVLLKSQRQLLVTELLEVRRLASTAPRAATVGIGLGGWSLLAVSRWVEDNLFIGRRTPILPRYGHGSALRRVYLLQRYRMDRRWRLG